MKCKYVVVNYVTIVLFPPHLTHRDVADGVGSVTSAGFIGRSKTTESGFYCYGESQSLGIMSSKDDQVLLDLFFKSIE